MSRAKTRPRDAVPRWSIALAQIAFVAMFTLVLGGPWMTDRGDETLSHVREIGYACILLATLVAIRPWRQPERLLVLPWPLVVALGYCAVSLFWAFEPGVGVRRLVLTTITLWSLFALLRQLGLERSLKILRVMFVLLLAVNFLVVLAFPSIGIHGPDEADLANQWRGIMSQKNWAGLTCAVTVLLFVFDAAKIALAVRIGVSLAAIAFLVMTGSQTSMGMGAAALLAGGLLAWRAATAGQRRLAPPGWAWVPLALLAALFVHMAVDPQAYLQMVSEPAGFTGRFQIWSALIRAYADRPWTGVGYGSLWDLGPEGPIHAYAGGWVSEVSQAHNGYLDLLVQIGVPGTLIVLFATLVWPLERLLRGGDQPARILGAALLIFCLGHNFTESTLFDRDTLGQILLMLSIALLWAATPAEAVPVPPSGGRGQGSGSRDQSPAVPA
jgi:O-antigen ligase